MHEFTANKILAQLDQAIAQLVQLYRTYPKTQIGDIIGTLDAIEETVTADAYIQKSDAYTFIESEDESCNSCVFFNNTKLCAVHGCVPSERVDEKEGYWINKE